MAFRVARVATVMAALALGLAACGGRATAPDDGGTPDGTRPDAGLPDGARPDAAGTACGPYPGGACQAPAVCDVSGCAPGAGGECVVPQGSCPLLWAPVCGCDGTTYDNDCVRLAAGAAFSHDGVCVQLDGGGGCLDDDLEPNDTPATATSLDGALQGHPAGVSLYGLEICSTGDLDYYSFTLTSAKAASWFVQFAWGPGGLRASVLDAGLSTVATAAYNPGGLRVDASLAPGKYYLLVGPGTGGELNTYDFSLTFQ